MEFSYQKRACGQMACTGVQGCVGMASYTKGLWVVPSQLLGQAREAGTQQLTLSSHVNPRKTCPPQENLSQPLPKGAKVPGVSSLLPGKMGN